MLLISIQYLQTLWFMYYYNKMQNKIKQNIYLNGANATVATKSLINIVQQPDCEKNIFNHI